MCERHLAAVRAADWPRLSTRTVAYCHAILRAALSDAVADEMIGRSTATLVSPPAGAGRRARPLTPDEATAVLAAAVQDRLRPLWLLMLAAGLRRGEALALRSADVDLDRRTLTVSRSLQRLRGEADTTTGRRRGRLVELEPKTQASAATIAIPGRSPTPCARTSNVSGRSAWPQLWWADPGLVFTTAVARSRRREGAFASG